MKKFLEMLKDSALELKNLRVMIICAMFAAIAVVLNQVASINVGPYIKIGFSGIPNQLVDWLFGPVTGGLFAAALDVIKFMLKPDGTFFFGFTFDAMLAAFIYGVSYYKRPISIWRILITKGIVAVVVNMLLATYWMSILYGKGFIALFPARALKNLIMWPIDSVIYFIVATAIQKTGVLKTLEKG